MIRRFLISLLCVAACGGDDDDGNGHPDAGAPPPPGFALSSIQGGLAYTVKTTIGGSQTFDLDIDTGSTTLGVAATACTACPVTPKYTPGASAMDMHSTSMATYGDGTGWNAENFSDTVKLMGQTDDITMRFGAINQQNGFFRSDGIQGIIGFAAMAIASPGTDSFVAKRVGAGDNGKFAFQLCPDDGTVWLNGFDPAATAGDMQASPMVALSLAQPFYEVNIMSASVGTTNVSLTGEAVVDTGTTVLLVSTAVETKIFNAISSSAGWKALFPSTPVNEGTCLNTTKTHAEIDAMLPTLTLTVPAKGGGTPITLTLPATQSYLMDLTGMGLCMVIAAADGLPTIIGDAFMRGFVTEFDTVGKTISFAPQKGCDFAKPMQKLGAPLTLKHPDWYIRPEWRAKLARSHE